MEPDSVSDTVMDQGSWWIWACWLKSGNDYEFLYGCAAATSRAPAWKAEVQKANLRNNFCMIVQQCTISAFEFSELETNFRDGLIDLTSIFGQATPNVSIRAIGSSIQNVLGHTAATNESYFSFPDTETSPNTRANFAEILRILERELNFPFSSSYVHHLGSFEVFHLKSWLDKQQPFALQVVSSTQENGKSRYLEMRRGHDFAQHSHLLHVVGLTNDNVLFDRICLLQAGELSTKILDFLEPLDNIEFRLFDYSGGHLLHHEKMAFLREIRIGMSIVGKQITIADKLESRAAQKNANLGGRAGKIISHTTQRSQVNFPAVDAIRNHKQTMQLWRDKAIAPLSEDLWLVPDVESEVVAIEHLNKLVNSVSVHTAVLIDPWFGETALKRFATRLTSQDLTFIIITSLADIDPDSDEQLAPGGAVEKLKNALEQVMPYINPKISLLNLRNGKTQAFHDRYLLLRYHEGPDRVYLLSNSLNKSAGDWPFCISLLSRDVTLQVVPYIEGLCLGKDIAGKTNPSITFQWPNV
jgi:hypothetical protein